ncbi:hypothetical protein N7G274_003180 [Stereocaulon virgatum]|uniref:Uncharacterized protein n=1 Tax=Stereocaulon virgatum TaxID=373712 RepID=A0ABR4AH32_9LECA
MVENLNGNQFSEFPCPGMTYLLLPYSSQASNGTSPTTECLTFIDVNDYSASTSLVSTWSSDAIPLSTLDTKEPQLQIAGSGFGVLDVTNSMEFEQGDHQSQVRTTSRETSVLTVDSEATMVTEADAVIRTLKLDVYFAKPNNEKRITREAQLDTQADGNFISETLVDFLGCRMQEYHGPGFWTAGGKVLPIGTATIYFEWEKSKKLRERRFLVLSDKEEQPFDLILGNKFINDYKIYNLSSDLLVLALAPSSANEKTTMKRNRIEQQRQRDRDMEREADRNKQKRAAEKLRLQ